MEAIGQGGKAQEEANDAKPKQTENYPKLPERTAQKP